MATVLSTDYYAHAIDLSTPDAVERELQDLLDTEIHNVDELKAWLQRRLVFNRKVREVMSGHMIDFHRDTESEEKKAKFLNDQSIIDPILTKFDALLSEKFVACPFTQELDEEHYGLMKRYNQTAIDLYREENIPLKVREQELVTRYNELIGGLMADWEGAPHPFPFVFAKMDHPNRDVREAAWRAVNDAMQSIKPECDTMMSELVQLRHQMALNAGFENFRDYSFRLLNREYSPEDCKRLHSVIEEHVVPVWDRLAKTLQQELGVDAYRPWDTTPCTLSTAPFSSVDELMDGVERIFARTDGYFLDRFKHMRHSGLLDLESRKGKAPGGFCDFLEHSNNTFVFANFSPSFFAVIALLHEMGHAVNGYLQIRDEPLWSPLRAEVAELYSHGMELLCLDKLDEFYTSPTDFKNAKREELHRSLSMLLGPLSGDAFQHWMYENPHHTPAERDAKFHEIYKRFVGHPVDDSGLEANVSMNWINSIHYFAYPFYNIEYTMSEFGALQLFEMYRTDPTKAIEYYKRGCSADYTSSIAETYRETGVSFEFTPDVVSRTARFLEGVIDELA